MTRPRICSLFIIWLFCVATVIASPAQSVFFTTLASFDGPNGDLPYSSLIQATDGNFYGTTLDGGAHGSGTVFKITSGGTLTRERPSTKREPTCRKRSPWCWKPTGHWRKSLPPEKMSFASR